jgi:outer membrane immunogenic protein
VYKSSYFSNLPPAPRYTGPAPVPAIKTNVKALIIVAAVLGGPVVAAELEQGPPPLQSRSIAPAPYSWSGPYVGAGIGARYNAVDANVTSATVGTPPSAIPLPQVSEPYTNLLKWWGAGPGAMQFIDNIAIGTRIYGGWNFQVAPVVVLGVEADFLYANESAVFHGSPYPANLLFGTPSPLPFGATSKDEFKVKTKWDGSLRLRGGWVFNPDSMFYLTAGLVWAHLGAESTCSTVPTPNVSNCAPGNYFSGTLGPATITHSATKLGWTVGAGVDRSFGSNWIARAQYRFSDFGYPSLGAFTPFAFTDIRQCTGCSASGSPLTVSYELPVMQHTFEVGIAYKFTPFAY